MVEGAPLLREYTGDRIEGSNPFLSAIGWLQAVGSPRSSLPIPVYSDQRRIRLMFLFFSNRLGCLGSIIISIVLSVVVMALLGLI